MKLTEKPEFIQWPVSHYIYIEKTGSIQSGAPAAWQELHQKVAEVSKLTQVIGYTSLYKIEPQTIYRAGVMVSSKPETLPAGLCYEKFHGGKYAKFVLTGSYTQLPEACGKVFEIVKKTQLPVRPDFYLENYVHDPRTTPEEQLITEILVPTT